MIPRTLVASFAAFIVWKSIWLTCCGSSAVVLSSQPMPDEVPLDSFKGVDCKTYGFLSIFTQNQSLKDVNPSSHSIWLASHHLALILV